MPEKKKRGRPKAEVDGDLVEDLASILCTNEEIADICGVHKDTLTRNYADRLKAGRANGRQSLRRELWKWARKGNGSLLVFLAKNHLGMSDRVEWKGEIEVSEREKKADALAGLSPEDRAKVGEGILVLGRGILQEH